MDRLSGRALEDLMELHPGPFDRVVLKSCWDTIPRAVFSAKSDLGTSGVHQGYQSAHLMLNGMLEPAGVAFDWIFEEFAPVLEARATILHPGGFIGPHVDHGRPYLDRWQIPVRPAGSFRVDGRQIRQTAGVPWRVEYWRRHQVEVPRGPIKPRLTILIDRAVERTDIPEAEYQVFL